MEKEFTIHVKGYYQDSYRVNFPTTSGIYFVYKGVFNVEANFVTLSELLYIGETPNLYQCHNEHDRRQDFIKACLWGEKVFYAFADFTGDNVDRARIHAALLYMLHPSLNTLSRDYFNYPETIVNITGDRHAFIPNYLKVPF